MLKWVLLLCLVGASQTVDEWASPCPRVFVYESSRELDKWYGIVTLRSQHDLEGVWLVLILDRPSLMLGNWFGQVVTTDTREYLIKNKDFRLKAHKPQIVRFFVKYDAAYPVPKVVELRLNARTICPDETVTEATPVTVPLLTSPPLGARRTHPPGYLGDADILPTPKITKVVAKVNGTDYECGIVDSHPRPLITLGEETAEGEFPWHIALYDTNDSSKQRYLCGGSLVTTRHVITAGHCVTIPRTAYPVETSTLIVYLGKHYLKRFTGASVQVRDVARIEVHPDFNGRTLKNDISALELTDDVRVTEYVRPICLWQDDVDVDLLINKPGSVVGWGVTEKRALSETLMRAEMPIVSRETCVKSYPEFFRRYTSDKTFCAGYRNGTSVCNGDSGGGMIFSKKNPRGAGVVWQLRGIVSLSVATESSCDTKHFVVFTDVPKYLDWIENAIRS